MKQLLQLVCLRLFSVSHSWASDVDIVRSACNSLKGNPRIECLAALGRLVWTGTKATNRQSEDEVGQAKAKIVSMLNDPESARFGSIEISPSTKAICGTVNAKNAMGGYGQPRRFFVTGDLARIEDSEVWKFNVRWVESCPEF